MDRDCESMPPASIHTSGSHAYVSSYIPTSVSFPARTALDLISSTSVYSVASECVRAYNQTPSVEEALATLERAALALRRHRYRDALQLYLEGGYAMASVAERQSDPKICNLLTSKSVETLNWCGRLCDWIEGRNHEKHPRPGVHKIGITVRNWNSDWIGPHLDDEEAKRVWYTPVSVPSALEFTNVGYRLRCVEVNRRPRLMVCITIFNEGPEQLQATLRKLANNVAYLTEKQPKHTSKSLSKSYSGDDVWSNMLVCIVADGREHINEKMLEYLETIGLYDEDLVTINSAGTGAQCHLFEHTLQLTMDDGKHMPPLQTVFALKEKNASKLDSHNWFFSAFAEQIQPEYTILIDVGTLLTKAALYHLLYAFEANPQIGGACGQLSVDKPFHNLGNWVVSAQHFEYKMSNILDRSFESCFGFIRVLPGAFSGYRYEAIRGDPLQAYFQTLNVDLDVLGPFAGNMYLAEDRILCFELLARKDCCWTMHYVKEAVARTDVPVDLVSLIAQRRRWLNGAFFATLFTIWNFNRVYSQSSHSYSRKFFLTWFYVYYVVDTLIAFLLPASVYLGLLYVVFQGFQQNRLVFVDTSQFPQPVLNLSVYFYNVVYLFGLIMLVIIGMGNNPKHMKLTYYFVSFVFGTMMILSTLVGLGIFIAKATTLQSMMSYVLTLGLYVIGPALHGEAHHVLLTLPHFTALIPSFVNIFTIYSFCNLQDLSWGTKGLSEDPELTLEDDNHENGDFKDMLAKRRALKERRREFREFTVRRDNKKREFEAFRTNILLLWVFSNLILALTTVSFSNAKAFLHVLYVTAAVFNSARLVGCIGHLVYTNTEEVRRLVLNVEKSENDTLPQHAEVRESAKRHRYFSIGSLVIPQRKIEPVEKHR